MKFDDFKSARRWNACNRLFQVTLSIVLVLGLSFLASQPRFQKRWDLGSESRHSLSFETQKYLKSVGVRVLGGLTKEGGEPVYIYSLVSLENLSPEERAASKTFVTRINHLLDDIGYESAQVTGGEWLKVEAADPVRNAGVRREVENRFENIGRDVVLIVAYKDRKKYITRAELLSIRSNEHGQPMVAAFKGESVLVGALLEVTNEKRPIVYLTSGHGEMSPNDVSATRGLSSFIGNLKSRNLEVRTLDLTGSAHLPGFSEVPKDANLVIIPSPKTAFRPAEVEKLRRYMSERNGRVIVLTDVGIDSGLTYLFDDWGILADDARAWDKSSDVRMNDGDLRLNISNKIHALTRTLAAADQVLYVTEARPVRIDPASSALDDKTLNVEQLIGTSSADSWGEFNYKGLQPAQFKYDPERDIGSPVSVATIAERTSGKGLNLKITRGRLLVFGSGSIAANARFGEGMNSWFLINAVEWMLEREQLLQDVIPPRPIAEFKLKVSMSDLNRVAWRFTLLPGGILLFGILMHLWRRST